MCHRQFVLSAVCHVDAEQRQPRITVFRKGRDEGESGAIDALRVSDGHVNQWAEQKVVRSGPPIESLKHEWCTEHHPHHRRQMQPCRWVVSQVKFLPDHPFPRLQRPRWLRPHIRRFALFFVCILRRVEISESVRLRVDDAHGVTIPFVQRVALRRNRKSEQCARFSIGIVVDLFNLQDRLRHKPTIVRIERREPCGNLADPLPRDHRHCFDATVT